MAWELYKANCLLFEYVVWEWRRSCRKVGDRLAKKITLNDSCMLGRTSVSPEQLSAPQMTSLG
jgi:hypothetical protein